MIEAAKVVAEISKAEFKTLDEAAGPIPLPDNALDGFRSGACLDLRVRFAMELLSHSPVMANLSAWPQERVAKYALDISTELFDLAQARGLITPFGDFENDEHLKAHVRRQVGYQLYSNSEAQKQAADLNRIAKPFGAGMNQ